jgi:hypothetical protein
VDKWQEGRASEEEERQQRKEKRGEIYKKMSKQWEKVRLRGQEVI